MIESIYADAFLYNALKDSAALVAALGGPKIYRDRAPQNTSPPFVIYNYMGGRDITTGDKTRLFVELLYQVRVVTRNGVGAEGRAAANVLDDALGNMRRQSFEIEGVRFNYNVWREMAISRMEEGEIAEVYYINTGGLYRLQCFEGGA
jgi:hypothetical protein